MYYLTFGDQPSGVLSSQAIDVCRYIQQAFNVKVTMVFFISMRNFSENKKRLKSEMPDAVVVPMLPKIDTWKWNGITLFFILLFKKNHGIVARGVLATQLALIMKKFGLVNKVCFDGRGAYTAEWHEYDVMPSEKLKKSIEQLEAGAVVKSDFRIAVSDKLIDYWKEKFNYHSSSHIVVPCLLNTNFKTDTLTAETIISVRQKFGYDLSDVVLIYSGSTAGWQSFHLLSDFLCPVLKQFRQVKVLFMTDKDERIEQLMNDFPNQIKRILVRHHEVTEVLRCGDYGIMIREQTVTNMVAAPTKFAEYLSAGLSVLVSENLGDYSDFVTNHNCGYIIRSNNPLSNLNPVSADLKNKNIQLALKYFTKQSHKSDYSKMLDAIQRFDR